MKSHYDTLGVKPDFTEEELKSAYQKKAKETHPDLHGPESTEAFQDVGRAFATLSDPQSRATYDRYGEMGESAQSLRQKAEAQVAMMVCQAVGGLPDAKHKDIILMAKDSVRKSQQSFREAHRSACAEAERFRDAVKRVRKKKPGDNPIVQALEGSATERDNAAKSNLFEVEKCEEMIKVLDEYEWRVEPVPVQEYSWGGTWGGTWGVARFTNT